MAREFEFFSNINQFKEVVPGVEASTSLSEMQAAFERAKATIQNIVPAAVYAVIKTAFTENSTDEVLMQAIAAIQGALGNRTYYHHLIFKVVGKKKEQVSYYKYELQEMRETYLDNYWTYMDTLLTLMDANAEKFEGWTESTNYKLRQELLLKTSSEFSSACTLGDSVYFFWLTFPLQLEVIDLQISGRKITPETYADKPKLERNIKRAVAYATAADAVRQFDYPDLPRSLRNDIYNEWSKTKGKQESYVKEQIADRFEEKSEQYWSLVDQERTIPDQDAGESTDIYIPPTNVNDENDQHYFMS